jgi:hypothetical protein
VTGLVSFGLNYQRLRWDRGLLWLGFFALSAYNARAIPFFAVVGGPVASLNFHDFAVRVLGGAPRTDRRSQAQLLWGRAATIFVGLIVVGLTWPGLLSPFPFSDYSFRQTWWGVESDPAMRETALQLHRWREENKLNPDRHGLVLHMDMANYCAWYCPEEKTPIDYRLHLFRDSMADWLKLYQGLVEEPRRMKAHQEAERDRAQSDANSTRQEYRPRVNLDQVRDLLRQYRIDHMVVNAGNLDYILAPVNWFLVMSREFPWLHESGRALVFGWRENPRRKGSDGWQALELNVDRLAFGRQPLQAPADGPGRPAAIREWWQRYYTPPLSRPVGLDQSLLYVAYFQIKGAEDQLSRTRQAASMVFASVAGLESGKGLTPLSILQRADLEVNQGGIFLPPLLRAFDQGPPAAVVLAIRTARQAIHDNPDDPDGYRRLKAAYQQRAQGTREGAWVGMMRELADLREIQLMAAWRQLIALDPTDVMSRLELVDHLRQHRYADAALEELQEALKVADENLERVLRFVPAAHYKKWREALDDNVKKLKKEVEARKDAYLKATAKLKPEETLKKAGVAASAGLPLQALKLAQDKERNLDPNADQKTNQEALDLISLSLNIYLHLGNVKEVQWRLEVPGLDKSLKMHALFKFYLAAAMGNYREADEYLGKAIDSGMQNILQPATIMATEVFGPATAKEKVKSVEQITALLLGKLLLDRLGNRAGLVVDRQRTVLLQQMSVLVLNYLFTRVNLLVSRGLLALEQGDNEKAERYLRQGLSVLYPPGETDYSKPPLLNTPSRAAAVYTLKLIEEARK